MTPSSLRRRYCTAVLVAQTPVPPSWRAFESINNSKYYNPQCDINHFIHEKKGLAPRCSTGDQENEERQVSLNLVTLTFAIFAFFSHGFYSLGDLECNITSANACEEWTCHQRGCCWNDACGCRFGVRPCLPGAGEENIRVRRWLRAFFIFASTDAQC